MVEAEAEAKILTSMPKLILADLTSLIVSSGTARQ